MPADIPPAIEIIVRAEAEKARVPAGLALALCWVESRCNPLAVSSANAKGLFQLMPATGAAHGLRTDADFFDPQKNTKAGLTRVSRLHGRYGSWWKALAAYNRGSGWLEKNPSWAEWPDALVSYVTEIYELGGMRAPRAPKVPGSVEVVNRDFSGRALSRQEF